MWVPFRKNCVDYDHLIGNVLVVWELGNSEFRCSTMNHIHYYEDYVYI